MLVRLLPWLAGVTLAAAACSPDPDPTATPVPSAPVVPSVAESNSTTSNDPASPGSASSVDTQPSATTPTVQLAGLPPPYDGDVAAREVPRSALVPAGAELTGRWFASTSVGDTIVVAWLVPGNDSFRLERGLAAWRRFSDAPAWRAVYGEVRARREGVLSVDALTADVTGDRSDDALIVLSTGGSGSCGIYLVVDLAAAARIYEREACDMRLDPSSDPVGLTLTEAVYRNGDPHCCPSAMRVTVLTYAGDTRWATASVRTEPT